MSKTFERVMKRYEEIKKEKGAWEIGGSRQVLALCEVIDEIQEEFKSLESRMDSGLAELDDRTAQMKRYGSA